jgi:hypothetical protein
MAPNRFDTLPTELIQRIAIHTTPQIVLALSVVCRATRNACYDSLVFLELIQNKEWARSNLDVRKNGTECIARYALAEAKMLEFSMRRTEDNEWDDQIINSPRYLPSMAVLGNLPDMPEDSEDGTSHVDCLQRFLKDGSLWKSFYTEMNGKMLGFAIYIACLLMKGES